MNPYIESFLPLFVAMNLPGVLPIFMGLTDGMTEVARRKLVLSGLFNRVWRCCADSFRRSSHLPNNGYYDR